MAKKIKIDIESLYLDVLKLVKTGITIQNSCKAVGIDTSKFYKSITKEQKKELRFYKSSTLKYGIPGNRTRLIDIHNLYYDEDELF